MPEAPAARLHTHARPSPPHLSFPPLPSPHSYGPPGTGKTLIARAVAAQTNATFLKLAGPQLVQMFIGDGAKMVRDAFALAKEKSPCIIFIDEIDAIGTKRFDSELSGDREVGALGGSAQDWETCVTRTDSRRTHACTG